jgi:hypothetical protein
MTGRKLSRTGLPLKVGQRTGFSLAMIIEVVIKDDANGRANGEIANVPAKPVRKCRLSLIPDFI